MQSRLDCAKVSSDVVERTCLKAKRVRRWAEHDGKRFESSEDHAALPSESPRSARDASPRRPPQQRGNGDPPLHPRQRRSEAGVHPLPECQVPVRLPRDVVRLGIREPSVVPVGGGEDCVREFSAGSLFASTLPALRVDRAPHGQ